MSTRNYTELREEIISGPKASLCVNFIVTNEMPKDALGFQKDSTIADILNEGRPPKIIKKEVGDGAIVLALGIQAGALFLWKLRKLASTSIDDSASPELVMQVAIAQQAVKSLEKTGLDVGDAAIREGLNLFLGSLLNADQIAAIKSLAEEPDVVTAADVSRALRGPWD